MKSRIARAALLTVGLALAGCSGESLEDIAPKAERQLPAAIVQTMKAKGISKGAPIMMRIFKEEGVLEVWKQKQSGRYDLVTSYDICKWSGKLGPKYTEGDRQAPEGFYGVRPQQMNPRSSYHLSFNIGFPNIYDRANGRTGQHLMVHGACSSAGCYSMTDEQVEEIYAFARDAFRGGQQAFQLQAFPFRMTPENMARYRNDPNYPYWTMLKEGYDHFEITKQPPRVDVCERRYVFNRIPAEGESFVATEACPPSTQPDSLMAAYKKYKAQQDVAFAEAVKKKKKPEPNPSILGHEEALLVADWTRRRARGEKVSPEPPSLASINVAASEKPENDAPAPVSAFASASTGAREAQTEAGVPPLTTGSLPAPTPNPKGAPAPARQAESSPQSRMSRFLNIFSN
ncbi:L,D-transpeptidase family protein [Chelativorans xinjiangense]|uniref:L,D-transpeptidase family protein n=1 Tax=Chelativorans xinjiangense TaxID=2681485 RepID=UPI001357D828|nr:murein L,D-transpeptidase family protein [Chelativorans xinjiangense]